MFTVAYVKLGVSKLVEFLCADFVLKRLAFVNLSSIQACIGPLDGVGQVPLDADQIPTLPNFVKSVVFKYSHYCCGMIGLTKVHN